MVATATSRHQLLKQARAKRELKRRDARGSLYEFTEETFPQFRGNWFHKTYYDILSLFAEGKIKRLMISVPPQHGKSEGSTRRLPAFLLGRNPDLNVAIGSYSSPFAEKFGRQIKGIIRSKEYQELFDLQLPGPRDRDYTNTAKETEIPGHRGVLKAVGRGGPLTGNPVDIMIMDDLYKDYAEACSPVIREAVWDWYTSVVRTRLHNDSQELIVFTRWHEDDLVGRLEKKETVINYGPDVDIDNLPEDAWLKINFPALKVGGPSELDPREEGEALWPVRHNRKKHLKDRATDPLKFEALYQGDPANSAGLLYSRFNTYTDLPPLLIRKAYTDTADLGDDYLCSIVYGIGLNDDKKYILDVLYTQEGMEKTEGWTASQMNRNGVNVADIESNNGGRGFARTVDKLTEDSVVVHWFHQGDNKESRIISNSARVMREVVMPDDWHIRWPEFYDHISRFKRAFKSNKHDDAADALTGVVEDIDNSSEVSAENDW